MVDSIVHQAALIIRDLASAEIGYHTYTVIHYVSILLLLLQSCSNAVAAPDYGLQ